MKLKIVNQFKYIIIPRIISNKNYMANYASKTNGSTSIMSQIDIQELVKLQDQDNRNFTLGGILSCLETIASKYDTNIIKKYNAYNPTSVQDKKNIEQLIVQIRLQTKAFQNLYGECVDKYNYYWFPDNLNKDSIIKDVDRWKKKVEPQYKIYFDNIIYLFEGNDEKIFFPKIKNKGEKASCDPKKQLELIPPNVSYINLRRKRVKKDFIEGKTFNNKLELFKSEHHDPTFEKINERYKKALSKHNEHCICSECVDDLSSLI